MGLFLKFTYNIFIEKLTIHKLYLNHIEFFTTFLILT